MSTSTHPAAHRVPANGRNVVVKQSFPAAAKLATPTDLSPQEAQAITSALNPLVADLFALYLKTKVFTSE